MFPLPLGVTVKPSRRLRLGIAAFHLLAAAALWLAARYWSPEWVALVGAVFLVGRVIYLRAYVREPASRSLGFALSFLPTVGLLLSVLVGVAMKGFSAG